RMGSEVGFAAPAGIGDSERGIAKEQVRPIRTHQLFHRILRGTVANVHAMATEHPIGLRVPRRVLGERLEFRLRRYRPAVPVEDNRAVISPGSNPVRDMSKSRPFKSRSSSSSLGRSQSPETLFNAKLRAFSSAYRTRLGDLSGHAAHACQSVSA